MRVIVLSICRCFSRTRHALQRFNQSRQRREGQGEISGRQRGKEHNLMLTKSCTWFIQSSVSLNSATKPRRSFKILSTSWRTRTGVAPWALACRRECFSLGSRASAKPCWRRRWRERLQCRSFSCQDRSSTNCSLAREPRKCDSSSVRINYINVPLLPGLSWIVIIWREFVQLFAEEAKKVSPCVIFLDEIDSVGGKRTSSAMHPYANQTINQLLAEMDG